MRQPFVGIWGKNSYSYENISSGICPVQLVAPRTPAAFNKSRLPMAEIQPKRSTENCPTMWRNHKFHCHQCFSSGIAILICQAASSMYEVWVGVQQHSNLILSSSCYLWRCYMHLVRVSFVLILIGNNGSSGYWSTIDLGWTLLVFTTLTAKGLVFSSW